MGRPSSVQAFLVSQLTAREQMARRTFHVIDISELLVHWYAGRSQVELADSLGLDRKTVRKYLAPAIEAGFAPGGPKMGEEDWRVLVRSWFPHLADLRSGS